MNHSLPRAVIETIVRKAITDIGDDPKRSTRNLVDMAVTFSEGRFQNHFFRVAQTMLQNENSAYYKLIPDVVANADADKLVMFGLNLGYNSCTAGAKQIRTVEKREHFNVPWSITLAVSGKEYAQREGDYRSLLEQGKALGVYTWMIYALDGVDRILDLAAEHAECAFAVFCDPAEITDALLDDAEDIQNMMFVVRHIDGVENACRMLRARRFPYSVLHTYGEPELDDILSGELMSDTEVLHPAFTAFLAEPGCSEAARRTVYQFINRTRTSQECPTVLWDIIHDSRFVDSVISEGACSAGFDPRGYLCVFRDRLQKLEYNIFQQPLASILQQAFPKEERPPAHAAV